MTTETMIAGFQDYYGLEYPRGQGRMVVRYLDQLADHLKPYLFAAVLKTHSATFRALPDIAVLETCFNDAWTESKLDNQRGSGNPVLLPDFNELATDDEIDEFRRSLVPVIDKWRNNQ